MTTIIERIQNAKNLAQLSEILNAARAGEIPDDLMAELPTFGGEEPASTSGVWSWGAERLLVGAAAPFRIVARGEP